MFDRILVYKKDENSNWKVWEAYKHQDFSDAPDDSREFYNREEAMIYAYELALKNNLLNCEIGQHGIEELNSDEIIRSLRMDIEIYKNPAYCPACEACGEEGCCSGANCKKNQCLYGEGYRKEFLYLRDLSNVLYNLAKELNPDRLEEEWVKVYDRNHVE